SFCNIEKIDGSKIYLYKIMYMLVMNAFIIEWINRFYTTNFSIGFSGVLFGLSTLYPKDNLFGIMFEKKYYPFIMLLVVQILNFKSSFVDHLAGIVSAYIFMGVRDMRD